MFCWLTGLHIHIKFCVLDFAEQLYRASLTHVAAACHYMLNMLGESIDLHTPSRQAPTSRAALLDCSFISTRRKG